jgi:hypothetical protein
MTNLPPKVILDTTDSIYKSAEKKFKKINFSLDNFGVTVR